MMTIGQLIETLQDTKAQRQNLSLLGIEVYDNGDLIYNWMTSEHISKQLGDFPSIRDMVTMALAVTQEERNYPIQEDEINYINKVYGFKRRIDLPYINSFSRYL